MAEKFKEIDRKLYKYVPAIKGTASCEGCAFAIMEDGICRGCIVMENMDVVCDNRVFVLVEEDFTTVKKKLCPFCSKNSKELPIEVDSTSNSNQSLKVEGRFLLSDEWKLSINYCPMCGGKLK